MDAISECYAVSHKIFKQHKMNSGTRLAAVDLGSNSFRLEIGRIEHGQFYRTEYLKETVRQGGGLDQNRNLTQDAMQRGWDCLARFGERLAGFSEEEVCAVATQTLREARNRDEFLSTGSVLLGFPIDVISGREEARLIYQGVAQALPNTQERRLVIDSAVLVIEPWKSIPVRKNIKNSQEVLCILKGSVELTHGEQSLQLVEGDSVHYWSNPEKQMITNNSKRQAVVLWVGTL